MGVNTGEVFLQVVPQFITDRVLFEIQGGYVLVDPLDFFCFTQRVLAEVDVVERRQEREGG